MVDRNSIRKDSQVLGSDGGLIGTVDGVEGDRIKLKRAVGQGEHHFIPLEWMARADVNHVHLSLDAATARDRWTLGGAPGAGAAGALGSAGAGASRAHHEPEKKRNLFAWLALAAGLLALIVWGLRGCDNDAPDMSVDNAADGAATSAAIGAGAGTAIADDDGVNFNRDVGAYLAGTEPTPRTFAFNAIRFDTGSAQIRPDDQAELASLAGTIAARPTARAEIVGYADAQGASSANAQLATDRAKAVMAALVAGGVAPGALTARGGGEANAAGASQEARRAELIITAR